MALDDLLRLIGPPPEDVSPLDWDAVHERLGSELPSDYRAFADVYPAMMIDEYLLVYSPDSERSGMDLLVRGLHTARHCTESWRTFPTLDLLPGYPEPGGLLSWGHETASGTCYWQTGGDPDSWSIVIGHKSDYWHYEGNFTSFLTGVLEGTIECPNLAEDFPEFAGGPLALHWFGGRGDTEALPRHP